ncbi:MAG: D-2-hydroxyacid dehydrogenase [Xanthomonadales bacterium]|nr:D-2-hydroxyacid dehydrogenase [Xanthomonadales bacterium]
MEKPAVLILSHDAEDYLPLLDELARDKVRISTVSCTAGALDALDGQPVVLGQPDLVAAVLPRLPELRWVQSTWAGVTPLIDNPRRDYLLTGVKGVFGPQMAEYVLAYLLAREIRIIERRASQRAHAWWPEPSGTLRGKTLGLIGTGSIGRDIARAARAFGMRLQGLNRDGHPVDGFERVFAAVELHDFLAAPEYVVVVLPATRASDRLLDARAFRAMRNDAFLVNVGRGNVIDERALVRALSAGELAGAVLDVFQNEPLPAASPLWDAPRLTVTAHVAADSRPPDIAAIFQDNYRRFIAGEPLKYVVDFEQGY